MLALTFALKLMIYAFDDILHTLIRIKATVAVMKEDKFRLFQNLTHITTQGYQSRAISCAISAASSLEASFAYANDMP